MVDDTHMKRRFKLVTFSKSYARKQKLVLFSEHSVYDNEFTTETQSE